MDAAEDIRKEAFQAKLDAAFALLQKDPLAGRKALDEAYALQNEEKDTFNLQSVHRPSILVIVIHLDNAPTSVEVLLQMLNSSPINSTDVIPLSIKETYAGTKSSTNKPEIDLGVEARLASIGPDALALKSTSCPITGQPVIEFRSNHTNGPEPTAFLLGKSGDLTKFDVDLTSAIDIDPDFLEGRGFIQSEVDPCIFLREDAIMLTYVDDCIIIAREKSIIDKIIDSLRHGPEQFELPDEGTLQKYLGIEIVRSDNGSFEMIQPYLIKRIIEFVGMDLRMTNSVDTPAVKPLLHKDLEGKPRCRACARTLRSNQT